MNDPHLMSRIASLENQVARHRLEMQRMAERLEAVERDSRSHAHSLVRISQVVSDLIGNRQSKP